MSTFLSCLLLAVVLCVLCTAASPQLSSSLEPFDLSAVRLTGNTAHTAVAALNTEYLLETLDPDNLLWNFWKNARLKAKGKPYIHSWEDPTCELRGHFTGHYLTALSYVWRATENEKAKARLQYMIAELAKVQKALGHGYLSAFPTELFDRLQSLKPVWAPYYTIHKIMAGLLDAYNLVGIDQALTVVKDMATYFLGRIDKTIKVNGTSHWVQMLDEEFGGMNDVMYNLYRVTQDSEHLRMAHLFDKPRFYEPLVKGWDPLPELHANTHLAQVVGFVSRYEVTQDADAQKAVANFLKILTRYHSYVTGGSNYNEHWYQESWLGDAILSQDNSSYTEETCTQYNLLKILRGMFQWTHDPQLVDWYERAILNGIIGVSRVPYESQPQVQGRSKSSPITVADDPNDTADSSKSAVTNTDNEDDAELEQAALNDDVEQDTMEEHEHDTAARRLLTADTATTGSQHQTHARNLHHGQRHLHHSHAEDKEDVFTHADTHDMHSMVWEHAHSHNRHMHSHSHGRIPRHMHHHMHNHMPGLMHGHDDGVWRMGGMGHGSGEPHTIHAGRHLTQEEVDEVLRIPEQQLTPPHQRIKKPPPATEFIGFNEPDPMRGMIDGAGPGRYIYMLPLGIGQSKGEGGHHWGYPEHSFWCCYGTAVESFAKLHDSIWFRNSSASPKELLLTQFTSNVLTWKEEALQVELVSEMHGPGLSASATLTITLLGEVDVLDLSLSIRIPAWTNATACSIQLNGQDYTECQGGVKPGSFCTMTRSWKTADTVTLSLPYLLRFEHLNDKRLEYQVLKGLMMGPFVMAGLTHHENLLVIDETNLQGKVVDPPASKIMTLRAAWNDSLVVRHDRGVMFVSLVLDGSDASDAVFRVYHGCSPDGSKPSAGSPMAPDVQLSEEEPIMLEALNAPGHFIGYKAVEAALGIVAGHPDDVTFCQDHSFVLEKSGSGDNVVLLRSAVQYASQPSYVSAYQRPPSPDTLDSGDKCGNKHEKCDYWASRNECSQNPTYMLKDCRIACGLCPMSSIALGLPEAAADDEDVFLAASQFILQPALVDLPLGSKILIGENRQYLIAPLGNVIEERYTVYFNVSSTAKLSANVLDFMASNS